MILLTFAMAQATAATSPAPPAPSAPVVATRPGGMQAAFDDATAAYAAKDWPKAIVLFDALEARLGPKAPAKVRATIAMRRGIAHSRAGDDSRAATDLKVAMAGIAFDDPALAPERLDTQVELTRLLLRRNDFSAAATLAADLHKQAILPADRLRAALLGLRATMFDSGNLATAYSDEAAALAPALAGIDKRGLAEVDTLRARFMLNRGQHVEAFALLKKALARQGGLDSRITLAEVVTRSDLAIAALLNNAPESAREYLAYTGQGRIAQSPFGSASAMAPPPCGGQAGLAPEDLAIIEFGIDARGSVTYAQTMYMSRPSTAGARAFADAVNRWSWQPEQIVKIPAFYKLLTRVELRCTNAVDRPSFMAPLVDAFDAYTRTAARDFPAFGLDAAALPALRTELARRLALPGGDGVAPLMLAIATNAASGAEEARKMMSDALVRLPADAPLTLRAAIEINLAESISRDKQSSLDFYRTALRELLAAPRYQTDPVVLATLRLQIAQAAYQKPPPPDAIALVQAVINDPRLEESEPLKTAALLQLANLQAEARDTTAASATLARTGLSPDQCALLDTPPAIDRSNVDNGDFPMEAQRWGFEGWVRLEQDISPDGRATGTRAVITYPPFVFRDAGVKIGTGMRYRATFRPGSTKGCTGVRQSITFRMPK